MQKLARLLLLPLLAAATAPAAVTVAGENGTGSYLRADDYRVASIAFRIASGARRECSGGYPLTGMVLHHLGEYSAGDRPAAAETYGLDQGPGVLAVVAGSPAARAGLIAGDVLLAVDGEQLAAGSLPGKAGERATRLAIEALEARLEAHLRAGAVRLRVLRNGEAKLVELDPIAGCEARVRLARSHQMNAFANRGYAIVTTRLLEFARSDDELALILGHEMAHVARDDPRRLQAMGVPNGLLRGFGKNARRVRETEVKADALGLRMVWAAGYDVSAAIPFWRRYYKTAGSGMSATHPGLAERERIYAATIAALAARAGAPAAE